MLLIAALMAVAAMIYTSVGHAGASAYLAIMALFAVPQEVMRPTALVLNVVVASYATFRYVRAGQFNLRLVAPFVIAAIPAAFLAGRIDLPGEIYRPLVGVALWAAAIRFLWPRREGDEPAQTHLPPLWLALLTGAAIGTLSGLTGTGGGIFLSPLILLFRWEAPRRTSGVAAAFILCVSISGLVGNLSSVGRLPAELPVFVVAAALGALVGTYLGIHRFSPGRILQALGVVLVIAGAKLVFT